MPDLDQQLRSYYQSQGLPDPSVERILGKARPGVGPTKTAPSRVPIYAVAAFAALILAALGLVSLRLNEVPDFTDLVMAEVAKNHSANYPVDVNSTRYDEVQAVLDQLDFPILPTRASLLHDFELLGGRYCSIQEQLAAQLKVRKKDTGALYTVYVAPHDESLLDADPRVDISGAIRVELWHDDGRLFALAGQAEE